MRGGYTGSLLARWISDGMTWEDHSLTGAISLTKGTSCLSLQHGRSTHLKWEAGKRPPRLFFQGEPFAR